MSHTRCLPRRTYTRATWTDVGNDGKDSRPQKKKKNRLCNIGVDFVPGVWIKRLFTGVAAWLRLGRRGYGVRYLCCAGWGENCIRSNRRRRHHDYVYGKQRRQSRVVPRLVLACRTSSFGAKHHRTITTTTNNEHLSNRFGTDVVSSAAAAPTVGACSRTSQSSLTVN